MDNGFKLKRHRQRAAALAIGLGLAAVCAIAQESDETEERIRIAAANMEDAVVVDCQLPGKLRRLGGTRNYLTPGRLIRTSAIVCRTRGGEYTLGDLSSGTLSLQRWLEPAREGDAEAQYYVARIYANGMDNVPVNYEEAARWYQQSADQGYAEAMQELGYLYERGLGVAQDELKALNLQREASGLGDALDYAYKIDDAEALAEGLASQLLAANGALQDVQLELRATQDQLSGAREAAGRYEVRIAGLVAEFESVRAAANAGSSARVAELEAELAEAGEALRDSQVSIVSLEQERDAVNLRLSSQMANGQATQLELRELLARTEQAEAVSASLTAQLAEAQQRLIQSDEELRRLRVAYREQSESLTTERAGLLEARTRSESDAGAFIAAKEAELVSREARIASLELQVQSLESQLAAADNTASEGALRQELDAMQVRYDSEIAVLRAERDRLLENKALSESEQSALFARTRAEMAARDAALDTQRRQIESLAADAERLRGRVESLEGERVADSRQSELESAKLEAQLSMSRQQANTLRSALDSANAERSALESRLAANRMELDQQLAAADSENEQAIALLRAEIEAAESTIRLQNLKVEALESQVSSGATQIATLKGQLDEPPVEEVISTEVRNAMAILDMARSPEEPKLGNYHALLIANENYETLEDLTTPIRDINEIEKILAGRYGFVVRKLTNATEDDIMVTLHDYANELGEDDNLLVYYAGRGSTPSGEPDRAYWLGVDADPALPNTWLLAEHVSDKIREIGAKRILLVTDSCFSRRRIQAKSMAIGRGMDPGRFKLMAGFQSRYVLTSGANVPYYDERGDRSHSMFAKLFMEILRQNSNVLSGEMLSYELTNRLRDRADDPDRATPAYNSLQNAGHIAGDFFFVPAPEPMLASGTAIGQDTV